MGLTEGLTGAPRLRCAPVVTMWKAVMRAARNREAAAEERRDARDTRLVAATISLAVSSVRDPTTAAIIKRNSGAS